RHLEILAGPGWQRRAASRWALSRRAGCESQDDQDQRAGRRPARQARAEVRSMHASTSAQEPNGLLTKNGRRQPSHGGTGWRGEGDRRGVRRPRRVRGWWLRDDALHMRDGGRAAAETDGARWPVVRAARNSHALLVGRTDDRHIDTRAVGAGAVAGHTG